jgi:hypothetical protein
MTPARAAEVLRGEKSTSYARVTAELMGAEALEFQGWLFDDMGTFLGFRVQWLLRMWHGEDSFLDYARAEWEKERNNG